MADLNKTQQIMAGLRDIPRERWSAKVQKTLTGLAISALGIVGLMHGWWEWPVGVSLALLGATVWSGEIVMAPLKILVALAIDLVRAIKNGGAT